jgi:AcrR family transcriptional regulator
VPYRYAVAKARTPRSAWTEAGLQALAEGGSESIRVEAMARTLGVSKGGFYWYFKNRDVFLREMLDGWEKATVDDVIARIEGEPGDGRAKLRLLFGLAPSADFSVELAIRDWARRDKAVAKMLRRIDRRRTEWLLSLFGEFSAGDDDAAARAMLAYSLLIGSYFVSVPPGGKSRSEAFDLSLERLLA